MFLLLRIGFFLRTPLLEVLLVGSSSPKIRPKIKDSGFSRIRSIRNLGAVISGVIGTLVAKYLGLDWLWYIFGIGTILSSVFLMFAKDGKKGYDEESEDWLKTIFWSHISGSFEYIRKNKIVLFLFLGIALFYLTDEMTRLVWIPYIQSLGFNVNNMGLIYSIIGAVGIIVPFIAEKILKTKKNPTNIVLGVCLGFSALLLFSSSSSSIIIIVALFVLYSFIDDILLPIEETITNKVLDKRKRSTLLSIKSMVENLSSIIGGPIAGLLLGYITLSQGLIVGTGLIVLMGIIYMTVGFFLKKVKGNKY